MSDELIRKYADEIERIIRDDTVGDYTWNGLLFSFLREVDESRTLKYEVENVESDTARTHSVLENVKAPVEDENKRYDIQLYDTVMGWTIFASNLTHDNAQEIVSAFRDDVTWRLVDHGASTEEAEPEKEPELLFDVEVTRFGYKELYAHNVSHEEALTYAAEIKSHNPRIVVSKELLENPVDSAVDEENRYYDVQVYKAGWWDYIRQVSFAYAQSALKDIDGEFETKVIDHDPNRVPNWAPFRVDGHVW